MSEIRREEIAYHEKWMRIALAQARIGQGLGEVPIGAVLVLDDQVVAKGHNIREVAQLASGHAELLVMNEANYRLKRWRLSGATLYVTLEPCAMCAGGIILSRVDRLVFGAKDPKAGCVGSLMNLLTDSRFNHQPQIISGILEEESSRLLKDFFKKLRKEKKALKREAQENK